MPTVAELTRELRGRLPELSDVNGKPRHEFGEVFDLIERYDPCVAEDYERFFDWMKLVLDTRREPFRRLIDTKITASHIDAMAHLTFVIGEEIARLLEARHASPDYLSRLLDFLPEHKRLGVFSLNYDCCLEDACRAARIDVTTGFNLKTNKWDPSLFGVRGKGINLYKLHGSLRWFGTRDESLQDDQFQHNLVLMELRSEQRQQHPPHVKVASAPELVLGPADKLQPDDPFVTLFCEFHRSLRQSRMCVIIGYGYRDSHVNSALDHAFDAGVSVLDVNPNSPSGKYLSETRYHHLKMTAKGSLRNNWHKCS